MPRDLIAPIQVFVQLRVFGLVGALVIECDQCDPPQVNRITTLQRMSSKGGGFERLRAHVRDMFALPELKLVFLCDIQLAGIEPKPGVIWSCEQRRRAAFLQAMKCFTALIGADQRLRDLFQGNPERLVVGTIENRTIVLHQGEGPRFVQYLLTGSI